MFLLLSIILFSFFIGSCNIFEASCVRLTVQEKTEFIIACLQIINDSIFFPRHFFPFVLTDIQVQFIIQNCETYDDIVREIFRLVDEEMSIWPRFSLPETGDIFENPYVFLTIQILLTITLAFVMVGYIDSHFLINKK